MSELTELIRREIQTNNGKIDFARFMERALYAPRLGYYIAGKQKFGPQGDFVTGPEISTLFSQCLAKQCEQILSEINNPDILEFGAGTGIMAASILLQLEKDKALPNHYFILELSPELQQRQRQTIELSCPHLLGKVSWLQNLPTNDFHGVVLANEVLDAMPVHKFKIDNNKTYEYFITANDDQFQWQEEPCKNNSILALAQSLSFESEYVSEINLFLKPWVKSIGEILSKGAVIIIDYGFPRHEYYHPDRNMGTLMCHYQHQSHPDPLINVGEQDITAHVDFTAVAEAADDAGLDVAGYTHQAAFLIANDLAELYQQQAGTDDQQFSTNQEVKMLTLPSEMGELFKVIALSKNLDIPLKGFSEIDLRVRL